MIETQKIISSKFLKIKNIKSFVNTEKQKLMEKLGKIDLRKSVCQESEFVKDNILSSRRNLKKHPYLGILNLENGSVYEGDIVYNKAHRKRKFKSERGDFYDRDGIDNKKGIFK